MGQTAPQKGLERKSFFCFWEKKIGTESPVLFFRKNGRIEFAQKTL